MLTPSRSTTVMAAHDPRRDRPPAHQGADRARGGAARRAHAGLTRVLRAGRRRASSAASPRRTSRATRGRSTSRAGKGAHVWDVDGNEYLDFHNGFGSMVQGHAHDAITKAVNDRIGLGTHFAAPTEDAIVVGEELARALGPAEVALRQLRLRGDDGRDQDRPRRDRPRHDREDLRLLPRPPRLRDGLDRGRVRPDRRPLRPRSRCRTGSASRRPCRT